MSLSMTILLGTAGFIGYVSAGFQAAVWLADRETPGDLAAMGGLFWPFVLPLVLVQHLFNIALQLRHPRVLCPVCSTVTRIPHAETRDCRYCGAHLTAPAKPADAKREAARAAAAAYNKEMEDLRTADERKFQAEMDRLRDEATAEAYKNGMM